MRIEKWFDEDAGPSARPYTVTQGRTRPARTDLNMITMVMALSSEEHPLLNPEHSAILAACQGPQSIAEVAATVALPVGVVKILVGDLVDRGLIAYSQPYRGTANRALLRDLRDAVSKL
jgi:Protein of unknown function (DUF742)